MMIVCTECGSVDVHAVYTVIVSANRRRKKKVDLPEKPDHHFCERCDREAAVIDGRQYLRKLGDDA